MYPPPPYGSFVGARLLWHCFQKPLFGDSSLLSNFKDLFSLDV